MPSFKTPLYSKVVNPSSGAVEPCYTFHIEFQPSEKGLNVVADEQDNISLQTLQSTVVENVDTWNKWINEFLGATKRHFAKPYSIEHINKIAKHKILTHNMDIEFPATVSFYIKMIQISGGIFTVNWEYTAESLVIDIPVSDELPVSAQELVEVGDLRELEELDEFDEKNDATGLEISNPVKYYDKQRVRELRMKMQLLSYKMEYAMKDYYDKYQEEVSDSEYDSESELNSDDLFDGIEEL
jgi:hypothetical protein